MALQLVAVLAGILTLAALEGTLAGVRADVALQLACLGRVGEGY